MSKVFTSDPFIIAEVGSNWTTLAHCLESITLAHESGADAVKFQAFSHESLYGYSREGGMDNSLPLDWLPMLHAHAQDVGIEFMVTAFSPALVRAVDPYVQVHKVASSDLCYPELLEAVAACGKPVLLSTGAAPIEDIGDALDILDEGEYRTCLLYCVASYPARTVDLRVMGLLAATFECPVGFSDHTTDIFSAPIEAVDRGAVVLEKHVTFFPELDTPDRPHSLTGTEFRLMVDALRGATDPEIGPTPEETAMTLRHRRRLVATRDVEIGETLVYGENYGAYRVTDDDYQGLSPFLWNAPTGPEGKTAVVAIAQGKGIAAGDYE